MRCDKIFNLLLSVTRVSERILNIDQYVMQLRQKYGGLLFGQPLCLDRSTDVIQIVATSRDMRLRRCSIPYYWSVINETKDKNTLISIHLRMAHFDCMVHSDSDHTVKLPFPILPDFIVLLRSFCDRPTFEGE